MTLSPHPDGRRRRKRRTAHSQRELAQKIKKVLEEEASGRAGTGTVITVAGLSARWQAHKMPRLPSPNSQAAVKNACRHIEEALGSIELADLKVLQVDTMYADRSHLSKASLSKIHTSLRQMLDWAVVREYIDRNVVSAMETPHGHKKETTALDWEQAASVTRAMEGHPYEVVFVVMMTLALRAGEALGLTWDNVDLEGGVVYVRLQARRSNLDNRVEIVDTLKTPRSRRGLDIPPDLADVLREHRDTQSGIANPLNLVFPSSQGSPIDPSNLRRALRKIGEEAGIVESLTPNVFRRTVATLALDDGADPVGMSDFMGHSDPRTMFKYYRKLLRKTQSAGLDHSSKLVQTMKKARVAEAHEARHSTGAAARTPIVTNQKVPVIQGGMRTPRIPESSVASYMDRDSLVFE